MIPCGSAEPWDVRYKAEPDSEVAGVDPDDGSVIGPLKFDAKGELDVPDDDQAVHRFLYLQGYDPVKTKEKS